ncbi:MAG: hypothetical protein L0226_18260 [Acidobacteria bacterium]|nr:hypothetical protein [Acidobacteriota bacterium]
MKRPLLFLPVFAILCFAVFGLKSNLATSRAQQIPTEEVTIIPLAVPTNVIGTYVRGASNDGKRLVFDSINDYNGNNVDSNTEIYVYDVDSQSVIQITNTADIKDPADESKVLTIIDNVTPAISGDGTKIVFVSNASLGDTTNDNNNYEIYLADLPRGATTATFTRITNTGKNFDNEFIKGIFTNYEPTINIDGTVIGFVSTRRTFNAIPNGATEFTAANDDGNGDVFLYRVPQKQYSQVTLSRDEDATVNFVVKGFNSSPKLSGNGQVMAFLSGFNYPGANANKNSDFNGEIFFYRVGDPVDSFTQVTDTTGIALVPVLAGDGATFVLDGNAPMNLLAAYTHPINHDGTLMVIESAGNFDNNNADRTRELWLYNITSKAFTKLTNQTISTPLTQAELARIDYNFLPSINSVGTFLSFDSSLNLTPATPSNVNTDNADGSKEVFRYDITSAKFLQLTFTSASDLFLDQRTNTTSSFIDPSGNLTSFNFIAQLLEPSVSPVPDLFQALVRPVTSKNSQEAKIANAASFDSTQVARGSIAAAFGTQLANTTQGASTAQLPFILNGVTVTVGKIAAQLFYVSGEQVNFVLPPGIANGDAVDFTINNNGVQSAGKVKVVDNAPGIFTVTSDGKGPAAANCGAVSPDGMNFLLTSPPCSVGNDAGFNTLVIYGTGWRNSQSTQVKIGDVTLTPSFSGAQGFFAGLDQINVTLTKDQVDKADLDLSVIIPATTALESNKAKISFLPVQTQPLTVANAASFEVGEVAFGSSALAQGTNLANTTASGPPGLEIAGVKATVAGLPALLISVSPTQVNFLVPQAVKPSDGVEVVVNNNGTLSSGRVKVLQASPGVFTTTGDGNGIALVKCGRRNPDASITFTDPPCSVGTEANPNILRVFGTGWRNADSVKVKIGDVDVTTIVAVPNPDSIGGDLVDVNLAPSLAGKTDVDVIVTTTVGTTNKSSKVGIKISFTGN